MSNSWTVVCADCKSRAPDIERNHGSDVMRCAALCGPEIQAIVKAIAAMHARVKDAGFSGFSFAPEFNLSHGNNSSAWELRIRDVDWWTAHGGHTLAAIDEYGRVDGKCGEWLEPYEWPFCCCWLAPGHEGEHWTPKEEGEEVSALVHVPQPFFSSFPFRVYYLCPGGCGLELPSHYVTDGGVCMSCAIKRDAETYRIARDRLVTRDFSFAGLRIRTVGYSIHVESLAKELLLTVHGAAELSKRLAQAAAFVAGLSSPYVDEEVH